ncbi:hypothetical protein LMG27177_01138 [Paraburkholderia fynbosensis]|uniref:site-specific DNA-methyltransferase (adenine-specific) n=1 Tax=Paraburkholderia fynbosensis TaxID=1200993 RepID=A0A6J5FK50_9BURK|nr:hypothetical protein LMG27177_01138 [Paraburkholderia fynbosensis]
MSCRTISKNFCVSSSTPFRAGRVFKRHQQTLPETLTDIQRAARFFYYLQQRAFGGKVDGQTFRTAMTAPSVNLLRIEENLSAAHLRLAGVHIENQPWHTCVERYDRPHSFFYCDPPYWRTEGYGVDFPFENYERMPSLMHSCKGKMMVSISDHRTSGEHSRAFPCSG